MTEDEKYEIAVLAEDEAVKRIRYESLGMQNTPIDNDKRIASSTFYAIARAEWVEAKNRLDRATARLGTR